MSLATPQAVQKLQTALHAKAKATPTYRFYSLYDKITRADVLRHACACCRTNGGAAGVDGQTFADVEAYGVELWLADLTHQLQGRSYRPQAVRGVYIPKPDGKQRPLGIPAIRDRVVQTAAVLVLGAIFEVDPQPEQYAYRPGRGAHEAVSRVLQLLQAGYREVVDADLSGYFDTIPHAELLRCVARRAADGRVLRLLKQWLEAPVADEDEQGRPRRATPNKDSGRGTPQGAPVSPLLANLYMRRFVLGWKVLGHARRLRAEIVNYADDFVICCRGSADEALAAVRQMMGRLQLTVNESKTRVCRVPGERFDFLGYTFARMYSSRTGRTYLGVKPSGRKVQSVCAAVREITGRRWVLMGVQDRVARLNELLVGWANYFSLGSISKADRAVDKHVTRRLRQWLCAKYGVPGRGTGRFPDGHLYGELGLRRLQGRKGSLPWANA